MPLVLHHLEKSRSHRILWLLEELGVEYELRLYERDAAHRAERRLREVHPLGKSPVVTEGEQVLAETGAIVEWVLERHGPGRLVPAAGTQAHLDYRFFLHYAEGSLMSPLLVRLIFDRIAAARVPFFVKPVVRRIVDQVEGNYTRTELRSHAAFLATTLQSRAWFAGDAFSAADIQMSYPVNALLDRGRLDDEHSACLREWFQRIEARPAYQRALERGGPMF